MFIDWCCHFYDRKDFVPATYVVLVENRLGGVARHAEIPRATKSAARSSAFQTVFHLIFRSQPMFCFSTISADDSIQPAPK
ncbi:hypothetical protein J6590_087380 [Homalodisca vitripennis]|nr:hypothetical protein J6590_087380 [Homalodisca vitripennis]